MGQTGVFAGHRTGEREDGQFGQVFLAADQVDESAHGLFAVDFEEYDRVEVVEGERVARVELGKALIVACSVEELVGQIVHGLHVFFVLAEGLQILCDFLDHVGGGFCIGYFVWSLG